MSRNFPETKMALCFGKSPTTAVTSRRPEMAPMPLQSSSALLSTLISMDTVSKSPSSLTGTAVVMERTCLSTSGCSRENTMAYWSGRSRTVSPFHCWTRATQRSPNLSMSLRASAQTPTGRTSRDLGLER